MIRTLLVGTDKPVRDTVKVGLAQAQAFHVEVAEPGWALDLVKAKKFDCVVVDAASDETDGLHLLKEVRRHLPEADLLLLTQAKTASRYLEKDRKQLNVFGVIEVPVDPVEFYKTLAKLIERVADFTPAP